MQRDTSPHWCQGSQVSCATACSRVRPHSLDLHQQNTEMEIRALPLNTHEISEQPLGCTAGKPITLVASRTSGSCRTLASVSIPFRSQVLGVWEMWILLFQTFLKGHRKKVGMDDESSTVSIPGILCQALCTVQGTRDPKRSWTHPFPQGACSLFV